MSQSGQLVFFTTAADVDPRRMIREAYRVLAPALITSAARTRGPEPTFEEVLAGADYVGIELLRPSPGDAEALASYYHEGTCLYASLNGSPLADAVARAAREGIAEDVRGDFIPGDASIRAGRHDLWEATEVEDGQLFGRATFGVNFFGYGTPRDWPAFRAAIFTLPGVRLVRAELERVLGPLEACVYWDV